MNITEWRAAHTTEMVLPSGLNVKLRRVRLADLAAQGDIPMPLLNAIASDAPQPQVNDDTRKQRAQVLDIVAKCALIDPPCADVADDTHIAVSELSFDDKVKIFDWANSEAAQLAPFFQNKPSRADSG